MKLQQLKQKIIEAVPEIEKAEEKIIKDGWEFGFYVRKKITLEDVCIATQRRRGLTYTEENTIPFLMKKWEFGKHLSDQSEETINFLHGIMNK